MQEKQTVHDPNIQLKLQTTYNNTDTFGNNAIAPFSKIAFLPAKDE